MRTPDYSPIKGPGSAERLSRSAGRAVVEGLEPRKLLATFFVDIDAAGSNNGATWANAFNSLQSALGVATANDEIWVAEGTYTPGSNRADTFSLTSGVDVLGGFRGDETQASQRNPGSHPTILSGDTGSGGAYHVVMGVGVNNQALLDGFTIEDGDASGGTSAQRQGGGIYLENSSLTISNVTISGNSAQVNGGGILAIGGSPTISGVTISGNDAGASGGGIFSNTSNVTITNSTISANSALDGGGIAVVNGGTPSITGGSISANNATAGGGLWVSAGTLTVTNTTISGNTASDGAGAYVSGGTLDADASFTSNDATADGGGLFNSGGTLDLTGSSITSNTAGVDGGGLHISSGSAPTISSTTIENNTATNDGGGLYLTGTTFTLSGYTLFANHAGRGGGLWSDGPLTISNSTITSNTATNSGGGIFNSGGALTITNTTFTQNTSSSNGAGLHATGTSTISGSTFSQNTASGSGGGLWNQGGTMSVSASTFQNNDAAWGAAIAVDASGALGVKLSLFIGNDSTVGGGGIAAFDSTVNLGNNRFYTNSAVVQGGGIYADNSNVSMVNHVFTRNFANSSGGGLYATGGMVTIVNSTFVQNSGLSADLTSGTGGAMTLAGSLTGGIYNSIIWMNFSQGSGVVPPDTGELQIYLPNSTPNVTVADSLVFGGVPSRTTDGGGNFEQDPDFIDEDGADNTIGTTDDNVRLNVDDNDQTLNSPAIGKGDVAHLPADILDLDGDGNTTEKVDIDLDGNGRVAQTTLDLGAYESGGMPNPPGPGDVNQAPVVGELLIYDQPSEPPAVLTNEILPGTPITVVARGVSDFELSLSRTDFYIDLNGDGEVSAGDLNLGSVSAGSATDADNNGQPDTFSLNVAGSLTVLEPGTYTVLARAVDTVGTEGDAARAVLVILEPDSGLDFNLYIGGSIAASSVADQVSYVTDTRPEVLDLGDLNGDGIPDAAVTSENGDSISVLLNNGDGTFAAHVDYPVGDRPEDVVIVDVDNDGDNDIVSANWYGNSISVLINNGNGTFQAHKQYTGHIRAFGIAAADFDGDGLMDIVTTSQVSENVVIWRNNAGKFIIMNTLGAGGSQERIKTADFNGDGKPDITNGRFVWFNQSTGTGNFAFGGKAELPGSDPYGVAFGDLDGDGDLDIVRSSASAGTITAYLNNGSGGFTSVGTFGVQSRPEAVELADINGDGDLDAITSNTGSSSVSILVGNGDGTFQPQAVFRVGLAPEDVAVMDIGTDGTVDIVTSNIQDDTISVLINNPGERNATGVESADGVNTMAIINQESDLVVFEPDGEGGWIARRLDRGPSYFTGQLVSWLDPKDGEVYYAGASTAGLKLFTPNGDGTYSSRNLSAETNSTAFTPSFSLKYFLDIRGNIHVYGIASNGDIVTIEQNGATGANGFVWKFGNISNNLRQSGIADSDIPAFTEFEAYTTRWDQWGLAGIGTDSKVYSVWIIPGQPQFPYWRLSDLSSITGAPDLTGGLATVITNRFDIAQELQTSWDGINIGGLNSSGELVVLWWVPANTNANDSGWRVNNLTQQFEFPVFSDLGLTSYFTPWGGINFAGLTLGGDVQVYWWVPGFEVWRASNITATLPSTDLPMSGDLVAFSAPSGYLNLYGPGPNDEALRLSVDPFAPGSSWNQENMTFIAERVE